MEQEEKPQEAPPLPVLPRLDRLDRLMQLLEEKHGTSERHICNPVLKKTEQEEEEDPRKCLTSALADVHHKGTLMDRLAMLENRVLKLSLEMDEGDASRSSSSTVQVSKIHGRDLSVSEGSRHDYDDDQVAIAHHTEKKEPPASVQERPSDEECIATTLTEESSNGKREKRKGYSKWIGWFRCGQERQWNDDFGHNRLE